MDSLHSSTNSTHASDLGFFVASIVRNIMFRVRFIVMGTAAAASNNAVERCNQILVSWIINSVSHNISRKIWQNEQSDNCAKSDGSFPRASSSPSRSSIINSPGRKVADRPPNGYLPYQNGVHNVNPNGAGNGGGANNGGIHPNVENGGAVMNGMGGNHGGNGNGNGGGAGNEGNGGVLIEPITINRYTANNEYIETIETQIIANNYASWNALARAIFQLWQQRNDNANPPGIAHMYPLFCWPGSISVFGRREANDDLHFVDFDVLNHDEWENVRQLINYLRLIELEQPGTRPIIIHRYNANTQLIETFNSQIIANGYGSWNALARAIFQMWQQRNLNVNAPEIAQMNPTFCWPGSMTAFGIHVFGQFVALYWPIHAWGTVRGVINGLQLFENAQHGNEEGANNPNDENEAAVMIGIGDNDGAHGGNDNGGGGGVGEGNGDDDDDGVVHPENAQHGN